MYFDMLKVILRPMQQLTEFTWTSRIREALRKSPSCMTCLCNNMYDFSRQVIERLQLVHSHEIEQLQLADLLIGAIGYLNRGLQSNAGKMAVIQRMQQRSGYSLTKTTLLREEKINLFRWHAAEVQG